LTFEHFALN